MLLQSLKLLRGIKTIYTHAHTNTIGYLKKCMELSLKNAPTNLSILNANNICKGRQVMMVQEENYMYVIFSCKCYDILYIF